LRAYEQSAFSSSALTRSRAPPPEHRLFSEMRFERGAGAAASLGEEMGASDTGRDAGLDERKAEGRWRGKKIDDIEVRGTWLEEDDIEEW
jgi:hypothetical protein